MYSIPSFLEKSIILNKQKKTSPLGKFLEIPFISYFPATIADQCGFLNEFCCQNIFPDN